MTPRRHVIIDMRVFVSSVLAVFILIAFLGHAAVVKSAECDALKVQVSVC
jgi:hypothetical protein